MNDTVLLCSAAAAAGLSAAGVAWLVVSALNDSAKTYSSRIGAETSRDLEDLFLFVPQRKIEEMGRIAAAGTFIACATPFFSVSSPASTGIGIALGVAAGAFALALPKRLVALLRERRRVKFNIQLVDALGTMANALRAGFSLNQAFESVVEGGENPIAQEFSVFLQQLRVGMPFDAALDSLDGRVGSYDLTLVCTAVDIARKTGGNLTEIFDRISETIRGRMRIERRVRTLTAQGRMQGLVVTLMPFALGAILTAMKPGLMIPFLASGAGMAAVAAAIALMAAGWMAIRKIVAIDV